jgi:prevent-host-death family protein
MSKTVGIRELKNNVSQIIEQVEAGETVTITRRGEPVARLMSATIPAGLAALVADGTVKPPSNRGRYTPGRKVKLRGPGPTASEYVSEGRR